LEEDIVQRLSDLEAYCDQFMGKGEDHMEVMCGQDCVIYLSKPFGPLESLTLRAVSVAARVV
jgi:hypothetical protein